MTIFPTSYKLKFLTNSLCILRPLEGNRLLRNLNTLLNKVLLLPMIKSKIIGVKTRIIDAENINFKLLLLVDKNNVKLTIDNTEKRPIIISIIKACPIVNDTGDRVRINWIEVFNPLIFKFVSSIPKNIIIQIR